MFRSMNSLGIKPDTVTLSTLINCCCCLGRVDLGFGVLSIILKSGLQPDAFTFNTLLKGLSLQGEVQEVVDFFTKIIHNGYSCDVVAYNVVVHKLCKCGTCKRGMLREAEDLFNEMGMNGLTPNDFTFNIMVQGFLANKSAGQNGNAMKFLKRMTERGFSPNAETISMLVEAGPIGDEMQCF